MSGGPTAPGMYMAVEFYVGNLGTAGITPGNFQVFAVDTAGKIYAPSKTVDTYWSGDAQKRKAKIAGGGNAYLWYTFEIPANADLQSFTYRVLLPGI